MKKDEAKPRIIRAFRAWARDNGVTLPTSGAKGLSFFNHVSNERSDLLDFRSGAEKWQTIHGWLLNADLVDD